MAFLFGGFRVTPKQFFNQVFCQGKNALSSPPHPIKKESAIKADQYIRDHGVRGNR